MNDTSVIDSQKLILPCFDAEDEFSRTFFVDISGSIAPMMCDRVLFPSAGGISISKRDLKHTARILSSSRSFSIQRDVYGPLLNKLPALSVFHDHVLLYKGTNATSSTTQCDSRILSSSRLLQLDILLFKEQFCFTRNS